MAFVGNGQQQVSPSVVNGDSARAPTPRMQAVDASILNPYALAAVAAAQQQQQQQPHYPSAAAAAAVGQQYFGVPSATMQQQQQRQLVALQQLLMHPSMAAAMGHQYPFGMALTPGLNMAANPTLAALYYNQLAAAMAMQSNAQLNPALHAQPSPVHSAAAHSPHGAGGAARKAHLRITGEPPATALANAARQQLEAVAANQAARGGVPQAAAAAVAVGHQRAPPSAGGSESRISSLSPEAVTERIARIISANEAIVEPSPVLLKRRAYHRQHATVGQQHSLSLDSASTSATGKQPVTRSHTFAATAAEPFVMHQARNLTFNGQAHPSATPAATTTAGVQHAASETDKVLLCRFCRVNFWNELSLEAHEFRCSKREPPLDVGSADSAAAASTSSSPGSANDHKHPLKKRLLGAFVASEGSSAASPPLGDDSAPTGISNAADLQPAALGLLALSQREVRRVKPPQREKPVVVAANGAAVACFGVANNRAQVQKPIAQPPVQTEAVSSQPQHQQLGDRKRHTTTARLPTVPEQGTSDFARQLLLPAQLGEAAPRPYCLTVQIPETQAFETPRTGKRPRHITAPTFVCLKRPQPIYELQLNSKLSMYSNWQQLPVNPLEAKMIMEQLGGCTVRARHTTRNPFWKYSVATGEMNKPRMTHSSFWEISNKLRFLQRAKDEAATQLTAAAVASAEIGKRRQAAQSMASQSAATTPTSSVASTARLDTACQTTDSKLARVAAVVAESKESAADDELVNVETLDSADEAPPPPLASPAAPTTKAMLKVALDRKMDPTVRRRRRPLCSETSDEVASAAGTYVRGRGAGRFVCDRCGIRCRKPSMLRKHSRTHANDRPFPCKLCGFSFKTKGNLTKHLKSKTHALKVQSRQGDADPAAQLNGNGNDSETDSSDRLEIVSNADSEETNSCTEAWDSANEDETAMDGRKVGSPSDLEMSDWCSQTPPPPSSAEEVERKARNCYSAPPAALFNDGRRKEAQQHSALSTLATAALLDAAVSQSQPQSVSGSSSPTKLSRADTSNMYRFMRPVSEERSKCEVCQKVFRKLSDLNIHMNVHWLDQSTRNRYSYACSTCGASLRSKVLLQKHRESVHGETEASAADSAAAAAPLPVAAAAERPIGASSSSACSDVSPTKNNNPRPFECADCDTAFRIHGHLAKHLRSKMHVQKLEQLGKLPTGAYYRIESVGASLNDIDTTDCQRALHSLQRLADRLDADEFAAAADDARPATAAQPIELRCGEEMAPSPPPPQSARPVPSTPPAATQSRRRCNSMLVSVSKSSPKKADSDGRSVTAGVWMPPTAADLVETPSKQRCRSPTTPKPANTEALDTKAAGAPEKQSEASASGTSVASSTSQLGRQKRCHFCGMEFNSSVELDIHLHTVHVTIRDGNEFKCPHANCGKVYPNKDNLRQHIVAHYLGGGAINDAHDLEQRELAAQISAGDVSRETMVALQRKLAGVSAAQGPPPVGSSPETPEESQTASMTSAVVAPPPPNRQRFKTQLVKLNTIPECTSGSLLAGCSSTDFKSPSSASGCDNSPMSVESSETPSRGSSRQSAPSPTAAAPAVPARLLMKRRSVDEMFGAPPTKRSSAATPAAQQSDRRCASAVDYRADSRRRADHAPPAIRPRTPDPAVVVASSPVVQQRPTNWLIGQPAMMGANQLGGANLIAVSAMNGVAKAPLHPLMAAYWYSMAMGGGGGDVGGRVAVAPQPPSAATAAALMPCAVCGRTFGDAAAWVEHFRTHMSERPHVCDHCDAGFTTAGALSAHLRSHMA